jgi:hypothetical protein
MEAIDQVVESFLRQDGLPLPRVTLGAVNRDGKSPMEWCLPGRRVSKEV